MLSMKDRLVRTAVVHSRLTILLVMLALLLTVGAVGEVAAQGQPACIAEAFSGQELGECEPRAGGSRRRIPT